MMKNAGLFVGVVLLVTLASCPRPPNPNTPTADFTAEPRTGEAPLTVQFTDSSTAPEGLTIRTWSWEFGDGETSRDQHPEHTYQQPGDYTVELTVVVTGGINTERKKNYITVTESGANGDEPEPGDVRHFAGIAFAWIPPGSFQMGSYLSPQEVAQIYGGLYRDYQDEHPRHTVNFDQGFWMGQYEVTQAQWRDVMGRNPSGFTGNDRPVERVDWDDCHDFVDGLNELGEGTFRLPSEAEWEYACRAGTDTEFYYGDRLDRLDQYAWHYGNSDDRTYDVGEKRPNDWNIYDMHGNVLEWCEDRSHSDYYGAPRDGSVWNTGGGANRMLRGGSWYCEGRYARSAMRFAFYPRDAHRDVGLRLVREMDPE